MKSTHGKALIGSVVFVVLLGGTESARVKDDVQTNVSSLHYAISALKTEVFPKLSPTGNKSLQNITSVKEHFQLADLSDDIYKEQIHFASENDINFKNPEIDSVNIRNNISNVSHFNKVNLSSELLTAAQTTKQDSPELTQTSSQASSDFDRATNREYTISDLNPNSTISPYILFKQLKKNKKVIKILEPLPIFKSDISNTEIRRLVGDLSVESDAALQSKLLGILQLGQSDTCQLVVVYDAAFEDTSTFQSLLLLPRPKMVLESDDLLSSLPLAWKVPCKCTFVVYLTRQVEALMALAQGPEAQWHFEAWHVVVGWPLADFEALARQRNILRTRRLLDVVPAGQRTTWHLLERQVYAIPGDEVRATTLALLGAELRNHPGGAEAEEGEERQTEVRQWKLLNLQGAKLRAITFEWKPSVMYTRNASGAMVSAYGIDMEVLQALAAVLNFTIEYEEPPPGELWGTFSNGSWSGMVGMLDRGQGDLGIGNLFLTALRKDAVSYSNPYDAEVSCFLASTVPPLPRWQSPVYPFNPWTWLAVLLGSILTAAVLVLFTAVATREEVRREASSTILVTLSAILREPIIWTPKRDSTRLVLTVLFIYSLIITIAYSSNLTALLTVTRSPPAIETVEQLYHTSLSVVSLGDFFKAALASADDPYRKGLAERFISHDSLDKIFPLVASQQSVYLHNRQFLEYSIATQSGGKNGSPGFRIMKQCFAPYGIAMALQRRSPLKAHVDTVIGRLLQSGLIRHWFLQSLRRSRQKSEQELQAAGSGGDQAASALNLNGEDSSSGQGYVSLSLDHLSGPFLALGFLHVLTVPVFVVELCAGRWKAKKAVH